MTVKRVEGSIEKTYLQRTMIYRYGLLGFGRQGIASIPKKIGYGDNAIQNKRINLDQTIVEICNNGKATDKGNRLIKSGILDGMALTTW
jgi:hypothetical protein